MTGSYSPLWRRLLQRFAPFLFRRCNMGNYHARTDTWCWCGVGCHGVGLRGLWNGGIEHLPSGKEYFLKPGWLDAHLGESSAARESTKEKP